MARSIAKPSHLEVEKPLRNMSKAVEKKTMLEMVKTVLRKAVEKKTMLEMVKTVLRKKKTVLEIQVVVLIMLKLVLELLKKLRNC